MKPVRSFRAALVAVAVLSAVACTDATAPTAPQASLGGLLGGVTSGVTSTVINTVGGLLQFVTCSARPERSGTFTVDSRGGTFAVDYAKVIIPRNAVSSARRFEMRTPSSRINSVIFTPVDDEGTMTFSSPVTVQLQYRNCLGNLLLKKKMVYTTDADDPQSGLPKIISVVGDLDNLLQMTVEGHTSHFSRYAVSY